VRLLSLGKAVFALAALLVSSLVQAACNFGDAVSAQTGTFNFGNVIVQRDTPVGTVLASASSGAIAGGVTLFGCTTAWAINLDLTKFTTLSGVNGVYQTNLAGVGLKIAISGGTAFPTTLAYNGQTYVSVPAPGIIAQLVKTSATGVQGGSITPGNVAKISISGSPQYYTNFNIGTSTVTPVACSLQTPSVNVPLGNVQAALFTGVNSTLATTSFNLGLNCDANTRVNVSMSGTQNTDTANTSVLALSGAGNADVAKGVGAQILYNNTPMKIGDNLLLKTSIGGIETFSFQARYYQTLATVMPGKANTTATLNVTYQ